MAYASTSPPVAMTQRVGDNPIIWVYTSTEPSTSVDDSAFFTNGQKLGMQVSDIVFAIDTDASPVAFVIGTITTVDSTGATLVFGNHVST